MSLELEIREELVLIKKRVEQLIKNIDKVSGATLDLFANEEQGDVPIRTMRASKNPFFAGLKKIYLDYFLEEKKIIHSWDAKDSKAINSITDKIILSSGLHKREVFAEPDNFQIIFDVFKQMLNALKTGDEFTYKNVSTNLFDSRFSTIASNIKNGKNGSQNSSYEQDLKDKIEK